MQVVGYGLAIAAAAAVFIRPGAAANAFAKIVLDLLWTWAGAIFFINRLGPAFKEAYLIGGVFILQGTILLYDVFAGTVNFEPFLSLKRLVVSLSALAAVAGVYPVVGSLAGRGWPFTSWLGTAPGPTAAWTLALCVLAEPRKVFIFMLIPAVYLTVITLIAAVSWRFFEEGILFAVVVAVMAVMFTGRAGAGARRSNI